MKRLLALLLCSLALASGGLLQAAPPTEYQVKAAYLLNFARYVEWPAAKLAPGAPLQFCVLGRDPFGGALSAFDGRQVQGHEARVRRIDDAERAGECHVLFVSESEERRVPGLLRGLAAQPVLTVSDIDGFAEAGGAIGLFNEDERVRFDINLTMLQRAGLKASAQLLRLGRNVIGAKAP